MNATTNTALTTEDRAELRREPDPTIRTAYAVLARQERHFESLRRCPVPEHDAQSAARFQLVCSLRHVVDIVAAEISRVPPAHVGRAAILRVLLTDLHNEAQGHLARVLYA